MSDKAAKKKQYILDIAKGVFAKKGFKNVTMKDIVEACDISRGGLYLYFDDTKEILLECLSELGHAEDFLDKPSAGEALALYLNEQKKAILNNENDLTVAVYEYLFQCEEDGEKESVIKPKIEKNLQILTALLNKGVENDEFYCEDCEQAARNIIYTLEGLKLASKTVGVTEKEIDTQLLYILSGLIVEEE